VNPGGGSPRGCAEVQPHARLASPGGRCWRRRGSFPRPPPGPASHLQERQVRGADGHVIGRGVVVQLLVPLLHPRALDLRNVVAVHDVEDLVAAGQREGVRQGGGFGRQQQDLQADEGAKACQCLAGGQAPPRCPGVSAPLPPSVAPTGCAGRRRRGRRLSASCAPTPAPRPLCARAPRQWCASGAPGEGREQAGAQTAVRTRLEAGRLQAAGCWP
jgi:hypothetical protein